MNDDLFIQAVIEGYSEMVGSTLDQHEREIQRLQSLVEAAYRDMMKSDPGLQDDES